MSEALETIDLSFSGRFLDRPVVLEAGKNYTFSAALSQGQNLYLEVICPLKADKPISLQGRVDLASGSSFKAVIVDFSSSDVRAEISGNCRFGSLYSIDVASLSMLKAKKTYNLSIEHLEGPSRSEVRMFGVLADQGQLAFLGTSKIDKGAKKSWTRQEGRIADLSKGGKGEVSPILKIDEDDVKASHGAALGKVPEESLFYLMSRGLSQSQAMGLITLGYLKPIVMEINDEKRRGELLEALEKRDFINA